MRGNTTVDQLRQSYGIAIGKPPHATLDDLIREASRRPPLKGDVIELDGVTLSVREVGEGGRVTSVGFVLTG